MLYRAIKHPMPDRVKTSALYPYSNSGCHRANVLWENDIDCLACGRLLDCVCVWSVCGRLYCWSALQHWRSSIPTMCLWSLANLVGRSIRHRLQSVGDCQWRQKTQGSEGGHPAARQLLRQAVISPPWRHISAGLTSLFRQLLAG